MKNKNSIWVGAIVISFICIAYGLIVHLSHLDDNIFLGPLCLLIITIAFIIVCVQFSKSQNGNITFGNVFAHGFKTSIVVALIMVVWMILKIKVIFPNWENEALQKSSLAMVKRGLSQEQIDNRIGFSRRYYMTFLIGSIILGYVIWGAISSLLGAAIAKKNPQIKSVNQ
jgi:hypothetical protein